jgi:hypothetical protein
MFFKGWTASSLYFVDKLYLQDSEYVELFKPLVANMCTNLEISPHVFPTYANPATNELQKETRICSAKH